MARLNEDAAEKTCEDCGKTKEDVTDTPCPYAQELHGQHDIVRLCGKCYNERSDDI